MNHPVAIAALAVDKQATTLLMPVTARRALNDLPDDLWTKVNIGFYRDLAEAVFRSLEDGDGQVQLRFRIREGRVELVGHPRTDQQR